MATAPPATAPFHPEASDGYGPSGRSAWLDVDWRQHQRWLRLHDRPVNVIELGAGPPVVFVHGLSGSWQNWLEQLPVFADRSDAVARRRRLRRALLAFVAAHPERLPAPLAAEQIRGSGKPGFVDAVDALTSYPIRERLSKIACPTLIVWGDRDRLVPVRDADEFERLIPDSRKVILQDTGNV